MTNDADLPFEAAAKALADNALAERISSLEASLNSKPAKRSFLKDAFKAVRPFLNRTTLVIALSLASAFGVVAPERATQLRDIVMMLPQGTGDLVN